MKSQHTLKLWLAYAHLALAAGGGRQVLVLAAMETSSKALGEGGVTGSGKGQHMLRAG